MTLGLYIPTMSRAKKQTTLKSIPSSFHKLVTLVTVPGEVKSYKSAWPEIKVVGCPAKGIAATRQWIMEEAKEEIIIMFDDDLFFNWRKPDNHIVNATPTQVKDGLRRLEQWCRTDVIHCGICTRSMYWIPKWINTPYLDNKRMMHVLCYNRKKVLKTGCNFTKGVDSSFSMDDFHMTLQLMEKGYPNRIDLQLRSNPEKSNHAGGASTWRTLESHNNSARALKALHHEAVTLRRIKNRRMEDNWKGMTDNRIDVTILWEDVIRRKNEESFFK